MPNPENLRTPTSEEAREMQKKSVAKRKQNMIEKKVIKEILEKRLKISDLEEMLDNLIKSVMLIFILFLPVSTICF